MCLFFGEAGSATDHRINASAYRAMFVDTRAHQVKVVKPLDAEEGGEMHQYLAVYSQHVQKAYITFTKCPTFFIRQVLLAENTLQVIVVFTLRGFFAI